MTIGDEAARADNRLQRNFGTGGNDQIQRRAHHFGDCGERSTSTVIAPIFNNEILALAEAKLPQLRQEGLVLSGD
jgi:hypothetical protein